MIAILRGVITLVLTILFIALAVWAWSSKRKKLFDSMARMPLDEDGDSAGGKPRS